MNQELHQLDEFTIVRKQLLSVHQLEVLNKLYLPLISMETAGFYHYLSQLPKTFAQNTAKNNHLIIMNDLNCRLDTILVHRHKLEALGLLKVYVKMMTPKQFIYEIIPPLSAEEFFNSALLFTLLSERISETRTLQLKQQLTTQSNYNEYQDITKNIDDIYKIKNMTLFHKKSHEAATISPQSTIQFSQQFDWLGLIQLLGDNFITEQQLTPEVRKVAEEVFILYNTTIIDMKNILLSSLNQYQQIDIEKFKTNARHYYKFYNKNLNQMVVSEPIVHETTGSKLDQLCHYYDTHSPLMVLIQRFNAPVSEEVQQSLEKITSKYHLSQGVMNVLCDYCLQQTKKKVLPNFKYLDKVAADFALQQLTNAKSAMLYVIKSKKQREQERENRQRKQADKVKYSPYPQTYKKQEPIPQYMKQKITITEEKNQDTQYMIEEVKNLINNRGEN